MAVLNLSACAKTAVTTRYFCATHSHSFSAESEGEQEDESDGEDSGVDQHEESEDEEEDSEDDDEEQVEKSASRKQRAKEAKKRKQPDVEPEPAVAPKKPLIGVQAATVIREDPEKVAQRIKSEEKRLAVLMIPKKHKRLYDKIVFGQKRRAREVSREFTCLAFVVKIIKDVLKVSQ